MRAQRCESPVQSIVGVSENKVRKTTSAMSECAQVLMYLDRLQHLVPHCPKDRPVSKLELIQAVIDYIYDLEEVLSSSSEFDSDLDDCMDVAISS